MGVSCDNQIINSLGEEEQATLREKSKKKMIKINLKGSKEKDTKPSRARAVAPKNEKLVFPFLCYYSKPCCCHGLYAGRHPMFLSIVSHLSLVVHVCMVLRYYFLN